MVIDKIVPPRGKPDRPLTGRVALVTGAARRIGHHLAVALASQGSDVVVHYRNSQKEAEKTADEMAGFGVSVALVKGELSDPEVASGLVGQAADALGRPLDILVNNASVFDQASVEEATADQWDLNQSVNLRAPFLLSQAFAAQLPGDVPGDIVNLNDYRALNPGPDHFPYTISKVGLHGLTRSLAKALAPRIRVNELALGPVLPPEKAPQDYEHTVRGQIPTGRFPLVEEVTDAFLFLLNNGAITGQTLCIDGGRHLTGGFSDSLRQGFTS